MAMVLWRVQHRLEVESQLMRCDGDPQESWSCWRYQGCVSECLRLSHKICYSHCGYSLHQVKIKWKVLRCSLTLVSG